MKKLILLALLAAPLSAQTLTTYTGTVKDLNGGTVTSGRIIWTLNAPSGAHIPGIGTFVASTVSCLINASGNPVASTDGTSPCTIVNNTALTPTGTSYVMCIQPSNVTPGSCITTFALGGTVDISTIVPTPATQPSYGIASLSGLNIWSAKQTLTAGLAVTGGITADSATLTGSLGVGTFNNIIYMSGFGRYTFDATGFQNAINDCNARYSSGTNLGGGKVVTGYGNFVITSTVNILPGCTFEGGGKLGTIFTGDGTVSPVIRILNNAPVGNRGGSIGGFSVNANGGKVGLEIQGAVQRPIMDIEVDDATSACTVMDNAQNLRMIAIDNFSCGSAAPQSVDTTYTLTGAVAPQPATRTYALTAITKNNAPVISISSVAASVNGVATYTTSTDITSLCSGGLIKYYPFAVSGLPNLNSISSPNNGNYYAVDCTAPSTMVLRNASAVSQTATGTATGIASQVLTVSGTDPNFATDCTNGYVQKPFMVGTSGFSNATNNTTGIAAPRQIYGCDATHIYTGQWGAVTETASATATMNGYTTTYKSSDTNLQADCKKGYLRGFFPMIAGFSNAGNNVGPVEIKACDWVNNTVTVMNLNGVTETHAGTLTFHGDRAGACIRSTWGAAGNTIWGGEESNCAPFGILYHNNQQIDSSVRSDNNTPLTCASCGTPSVDNAYQGMLIESNCTGGTGTTCGNPNAISIAAVGLRSGAALSFIGSGGGWAAVGLHYPFKFLWSDDVDYDGISSSKPHAITVSDMPFTSGADASSPCSGGTGGCATVYDLQQTVDVRDGSSNRRNTEDLLYAMDDYSTVWEAPNNTDGVVARYANEAGGSDAEETQVVSVFNSAIRVKGLAQLTGPIEYSQQFELGATPSTNCTSFASCTMDSADTVHYFTSLTANLTLNAPLNPHFSAELIVVLTQDGTGGRTVTWNGAFLFGASSCPLNTAANATSTYRFINFGSWQLVSCTGAASSSKYTFSMPSFCDGVIGTANATGYWLAPAATAAVGCASTGVTPMPTPVAGTITACTATASVGGAASGSGAVKLVKFTWSGSAWTTASTTNICTFGVQASTAACTSGAISVAFGTTNSLPDAYAVSVTTGQATDTTANVRVSCAYQAALQ